MSTHPDRLWGKTLFHNFLFMILIYMCLYNLNTHLEFSQCKYITITWNKISSVLQIPSKKEDSGAPYVISYYYAQLH